MTNPWLQSPHCDDFIDPVVPDLGRCFPKLTQLDCEAPGPAPLGPCNDNEFTVVSSPGSTPPFFILARLFDENCDPILDEGGNTILTQFS